MTGMFIDDTYIKLDTPNTSLIFKRYNELLEIVYYGKKVDDFNDYTLYSDHKRKNAHAFVDDVICANTTVSCYGMGCDREFLFKAENFDGGIANKFLFKSAKWGEKPIIDGLPSSREGQKTLILTYADEEYGIELNQFYTVFADTDVIAVSNQAVNKSKNTFVLKKLASLQMDFDGNGYDIYTYTGTWARERHEEVHTLKVGSYAFGTNCGFSSAKSNPFFMVKRPERIGGYVGFNLEYSGNHREIVESGAMQTTRVLVGIGELGFSVALKAGESFHTPEAVMTFGATRQDVMASMHGFVHNHIIPKRYLGDRPLVVNIWESCGMNFDRKTVLNYAEKATQIGAEVLVIDDGWFGKRDDETFSLGDWTDYVEKTGGLGSLADEIRGMGLGFGIWIEPEMVNKNSNLYRAHPDYVLKNPRREPIEQRCQLLLDLTKQEVFEYVYDSIENVIALCKPVYIKWDCNRVITDAYNSLLSGENYSLAYIKAYYRLLDKVLANHPDILIEGCASGGGRYDLGVLFYTPQIWASDMTDPVERARIQEGTLMAYPPSTMSAHVASAVSHAGRKTRLSDRFSLALDGVFGYEFDITALKEEDFNELKNQVAFYKKHRKVLLYGNYQLIESVYGGKASVSITVSKDKKEAIAKVYKVEQVFDREPFKYRFAGLDDEAVYKVRPYGKDVELIAKGDMLNNFGIDLENYFIRDRSGNFTNEIVTLVLEIEKIS